MNSRNIIVAIHQPNFFPWLGYFDKIAKADIFIFMDNVQFPKTGGGTWANRVKFLISGRASWITCPIRRCSGKQLIKDVLINADTEWKRKMLKSIEHSYGMSPFFEKYFPLMQELIRFNAVSLPEFNMNSIRTLCSLLDIDTNKFRTGSSLDCGASSTDLLIEMTKTVGGTAYMCGGGAAGYQDDEKFKYAGLNLIYQNFIHPVYSQPSAKEFISGLSVFDALFWNGRDVVKGFLKGI